MTLLSACGQNTSPKTAPAPANFPGQEKPKGDGKPLFPKDPAERSALLDGFPIFNTFGEMKAYTHPDIEGFPLGVLLGLLDSGGTFCSVSHLDLGYVATNAHCVKRQEIGNYYVVYFDALGIKQHAQVESIVFLGNEDVDDIAILKIPNEAALQWQTAGKAAKAVPKAVSTPENPVPTPIALSIRVWAFDPLTTGGGAFHPRSCEMSVTRPILMGAKVPNNGPIERIPIRSSKKAEDGVHFFVDQCDQNPIHGNSGSLVTIAEQFADKVGVYHWGVGTKDGKDKYDYIEYTGSNGRTRFLHEAKDWEDIFGMGYLFQHFQGAHPQLFF